MKNLAFIVFFISFAFSCTKKVEVVNDNGGENVIKDTTHVKKKVKNLFDCDIFFSPELEKAGLIVGEYYLEKDSSTGRQNRLRLQFLFEKDYSGTLAAILFKRNGDESARVKVKLKANAGETHDYAFPFKDIPIEEKNKIRIEQI